MTRRRASGLLRYSPIEAVETNPSILFAANFSSFPPNPPDSSPTPIKQRHNHLVSHFHPSLEALGAYSTVPFLLISPHPKIARV